MPSQTCTYRIGARRAGPIEPQIGTKTHWGNGHKLWEEARNRAKRESTGIEQGAATAASVRFECGAGAARISRIALSKTKIVAYSQTDTGARTSDPAQPNFCTTPD
jgi:hypothetical protein